MPSPSRFTRTPVDAIPAEPWRSGGGRTRELLAWPARDDWQLRVSVADIDADGPFSSYPGVHRWFAVIEGAGVALDFGAGETRLTASDEPFAFDGARAPRCRLLAGPTRDLNVMTRRGRATLRRVDAGATWAESFAQRGLFANVAGRWYGLGEQSVPVPARALLWTDASEAPSVWRFLADVAGAAENGASAGRRDAAFAGGGASAVDADGGVGQRGAPSGWWLGFTPEEALR